MNFSYYNTATPFSILTNYPSSYDPSGAPVVYSDSDGNIQIGRFYIDGNNIQYGGHYDKNVPTGLYEWSVTVFISYT